MFGTIASAQPVERRDLFSEQYGILSEQNIFLRDRSRYTRGQGATTSPSTQPAAVPLSPEQSLVLTGIVFEDGEYRAYFENLQQPAIVRVAAGEAVARGQVAEIAIDAVAYEQEGQVTWIEIGKDLTGAIPAARSVSTIVTSSPTTATPTPAGSPGSSSGAPSSSIAEQMRLRRLQELNRGR